MKHKITVAPPNSMFFISDKSAEVLPEIDRRSVSLWWTRSCIVTGCLMFADGETELIVSSSTEDAPDTEPAFDGILDTPRQVVEISTSERQVILRCDVGGNFTRVRIWRDHPTEPEHILIVLA